ncbi:MAG: riboflavin synthase [Candidatus Omnitrophica bacterium]|nr:riboflavin synthase [Candidatus Omnitrophota bacterium]
MFNGIVEEIGIVDALERRKNLSVLKVRACKVLQGTKPGDSIAVEGVCLTVTKKKKNILAFDMMRETVNKTLLGQLRRGDKVNLERALKAGSRVSGHFVTGHIDRVGRVEQRIVEANYEELSIRLPKGLGKYIVPKGSVALDGVSLTVGKVSKDRFSVYLIPFTRQVTTLGVKKKGDPVNIETDILAKYILNSVRG